MPVKRACAVEAATRLLAMHGLDGTSVTTVARAAGLTVTKLHELYPSKQDLVAEVCGKYLDGLYVELDAAGLGALPARGRLGAMARVLARAAHGRADAHRVLLMGLASLPAPERDALRRRVAWLFAGVAEAVTLRLPRLGRPAAEERAWQLLLLLAGPPLWAAEWDGQAVDAAADAAVARVAGAPRPRQAARTARGAGGTSGA